MTQEIKESNDPVYRQLAIELTHSELKVGERFHLKVVSGSMSPMLLVGDQVEVERIAPEDLKRGDVVVVQRRDELITHRLVGFNQNVWYTKGDRIQSLDSPAAAIDIFGKVIAIQRPGKFIRLDRQSWMMVNHLLGWLGWQEACLIRKGASFWDGMAGYYPLRKSCLNSSLAFLASLPFRVVTVFTVWLLSRFT